MLQQLIADFPFDQFSHDATSVSVVNDIFRLFFSGVSAGAGVQNLTLINLLETYDRVLPNYNLKGSDPKAVKIYRALLKWFRGKYGDAPGELGEHIFLRIGITAYLRAAKLASVTGVMVTASHNPEADNGAKICEAGGDMMAQAWEPHAAALANLGTAEEVVALMQHLAASEQIDLSAAAEVYVARDNRPSSPAVRQPRSLANAARSWSCVPAQCGVVFAL